MDLIGGQADVGDIVSVRTVALNCGPAGPDSCKGIVERTKLHGPHCNYCRVKIFDGPYKDQIFTIDRFQLWVIRDVEIETKRRIDKIEIAVEAKRTEIDELLSERDELLNQLDDGIGN